VQRYILSCVAGYLLGSISFGLIAAKRAGIDLRAVGSGNIGATNVARALGKNQGRIVLVLDALKGAVPVLAIRWLATTDEAPYLMAWAGLAAIVGHLAPLWHGFRGGKGAATGLGVLLAADPISGLIAAMTFWGMRALSGYTSVGSIVGALAGAASSLGLHGLTPISRLALVIALLVAVSHRSNIKRLREGSEPKA
jgi:glycerol-3-phosphate acyltransferase PlsY